MTTPTDDNEPHAKCEWLDPSAWLRQWIAALRRRGYRPSHREQARSESYRSAGIMPDVAAEAFMRNRSAQSLQGEDAEHE